MFLYGKNKFVFIFTYHLQPLATGKDYPSISKIGQQNPGIAFEDFISAHLSVIFRFPMPKSIRIQIFSSPALVGPRMFQFKYR